MANPIADEFLALLKKALTDTGADLADTPDAIVAFMAERAAHLSAIVNEPGFSQAVVAERNRVALRAGLEVSDDAAPLNGRLMELIAGALRVAAVLLI